MQQHDLTILLLFEFRGIREYTHWRPQAQTKTENMTFNFLLKKAYSLFATNKYCVACAIISRPFLNSQVAYRAMVWIPRWTAYARCYSQALRRTLREKTVNKSTCSIHDVIVCSCLTYIHHRVCCTVYQVPIHHHWDTDPLHTGLQHHSQTLLQLQKIVRK